MSRYLRIWGRFGQHRHDRRQHHRQHDGNGFDFRDDFRQRRHDFWNCRGWQRHASYLQQHHRLDYDKWRGYEWQSIHRRVCLARRDSSNRRHEHDFGQHRRQRDDREQPQRRHVVRLNHRTASNRHSLSRDKREHHGQHGCQSQQQLRRRYRFRTDSRDCYVKRREHDHRQHRPQSFDDELEPELGNFAVGLWNHSDFDDGGAGA